MRHQQLRHNQCRQQAFGQISLWNLSVRREKSRNTRNVIDADINNYRAWFKPFTFHVIWYPNSSNKDIRLRNLHLLMCVALEDTIS